MYLYVYTTFACLLTARAIGDTDVSADAETKENGPYVKATFYKSSQDQWNDIAEETKYILSTRATQYCVGREEACGMKPSGEPPVGRNFTESDILVQDGYPKKDRSYLTVPLAMKLPKDSGSDQNEYLSQPALKEIVKNSVDDINSRTGATLLYVDEEIMKLPPNNTLNAVIIPIACVVLIAMIIFAIIVRIRMTRKEHQEEADKLAKKVKSNQPVELIEVRKLKTEPSSSAETAEAADVTVGLKEEAERAALLDENSAAAVKA